MDNTQKSSLIEQLNLPDDGVVTEKKRERLESFLLASLDVFSLSDSDLGHISLVQHMIDSGEHPPSK